jgi:hypothetical protein
MVSSPYVLFRREAYLFEQRCGYHQPFKMHRQPMPPNGLRITRHRGALHKMASKSRRSCAPKAVGLHTHVGQLFRDKRAATCAYSAPLARCPILEPIQYLPLQGIDSLDVRKVFGTVLAERSRGHLKDEGTEQDEALGSGWELRRQLAPALFR